MQETCRLTGGRCQILRVKDLDKLITKISQSFSNCDTYVGISELQQYRDNLLKLAEDMREIHCDDCPNINQST